MSHPFPDSRRLPAPSRADRKIALSSKGHCTAHAVFGEGAGVRMQAESWTELRNLYLLNARHDVVAMREQALFRYGPQLKSKHVFDVLVTLRDGRTIAYTVKPERGLSSGKFLDTMQGIAWWVRKLRFADDTRLITEADFDPVELHNAQIFATVRETDPEAETAARLVLQGMVGARSLRDLTLETGLEARGYRAFLRLIRLGELEIEPGCRIAPRTLVRNKETLQ